MMPFGPTDRPSLGLSLLSSCLGHAGMDSHVLYPNLDFERRIGAVLYNEFALGFSRTLAAEWLFSQVLDPVGDVEDFTRFLIGRCGDVGETRRFVAALPEARDHALALVEDWTRRIVESGVRVVGLGSNFHQHLACLALARRIKEARPDILTVLGGVNCNDPMGGETFRRFPFIDAVITGPGEVALVDLVRSHLAGEPSPLLPGLRVRRDGMVQETSGKAAPEPVLDQLPAPVFDDYFTSLAAHGVQETDHNSIVPVEGSRGCWWGQKNHCVFCSENGHAMRYRSKSPKAVLAEFRRLLERYPGCRIHASDEILDPVLIETVMPDLAAMPEEKRIFFSIKANLRKDQLLRLRQAGVDSLQPGIESLDDSILVPMRKGVTALQNIRLLKWCREIGIGVNWAILAGFPFERAEAYERMAALVPFLTHLAPPILTTVSLQRFSPLFERAEEFGLGPPVPDSAYRYIYKADSEAMGRLAYRFHAEGIPDGLPDHARPLEGEVGEWKARHAGSFLVYHDRGDVLVIGDTRPAALRRIHRLTGAWRHILLACDGIRARHQIIQDLAEAGTDPDGMEGMLADLVAAGLLVERDGLYLALPAELNLRYLPPPHLTAEMMAARGAAP